MSNVYKVVKKVDGALVSAVWWKNPVTYRTDRFVSGNKDGLFVFDDESAAVSYFDAMRWHVYELWEAEAKEKITTQVLHYTNEDFPEGTIRYKYVKLLRKIM